MKLEEIVATASIIESVAVVISVIFIAVQLYISRKYSEANNVQSLVALSSPMNLELIKDRQLAEWWIRGAHQYASLDEVDQYRYQSMLIWWLILHENIFVQHRQRLLSDSVYRGWSNDLENFVRQNKLWEHWGELKSNYEAGFAQHVSDIVAKYEAASNALKGQSLR